MHRMQRDLLRQREIILDRRVNAGFCVALTAVEQGAARAGRLGALRYFPVR